MVQDKTKHAKQWRNSHNRLLSTIELGPKERQPPLGGKVKLSSRRQRQRKAKVADRGKETVARASEGVLSNRKAPPAEALVRALPPW
jgi:hypothetical protein